MIPHNKPYISKNSYKSIKSVIKSGYINYSTISHDVENKLSNLLYQESNKATLVTNGTSALFLALRALNIRNNDEVIIPNYTCTALLNAINLVGAKAIVVDVSRENLSFNKNLLQSYINGKIKAIIVVHTFGIACELEDIKTLNIPIIEDCSQALGSRFKDGSLVGSKGDISVFSFYATKLITGGIGGAITSKHKNITDFITDYINFDCPEIYKSRFNFQISDINSAMILSGLNELDKILKKKRKIAREYLKVVDSKYARIVGVNNFRFLIEFDTNECLQYCQKYLEFVGIKTIIPIENYELLHRYLNLDSSNYPNSEYLSCNILSIPIFPNLSKIEIKYIKRSLYDCLSSSTCI